MNDIDSAIALADTLTGIFPAFAAEIEGEEVTSYHQVVLRLAPVITVNRPGFSRHFQAV